MKTIRVRVTKSRDINGATQHSACNCPISRAIQRVTGRPNVIVNVHRGVRFDDGGTPFIALPADVLQRANDYDRTGVMQPFTFQMEIPS